MIHIEQKNYITQDGNTVIVLIPAGRLDITAAWEFRLKLLECFSQLSRHVVVNLGQVSFIDSSGLTSLVAGMRDAVKMKGSLCLCNVHPDAKLVFEVTKMDEVFTIHEDCSSCFNQLGIPTGILIPKGSSPYDGEAKLKNF